MEEIIAETAMTELDITETLQKNNLLITTEQSYVICTDPGVLETVLKSSGREGLYLHKERLNWRPKEESSEYVLSE